MVKLNIGGGKNHPPIDGWTIVDIRDSADVKCDVSRERLPFDENSVTYIYCSHMLEHIYRKDLKHVLDEFHRVLIPNRGVVRIVVPDIRKACRAYVIKNKRFFKKASISYFDPEAPIGGLLATWFYSYREDSALSGNGHVHCFDYEYLKYWLINSGFYVIKKKKYNRSTSPELIDVNLELPRYKYESLYVEARK